MNKFYVYGYFRHDGTPYYIGKGCGGRAFTQNCHSVKVPPRERIQLLAVGLTDQGALALERDLILFWGRKDNGSGVLRNLTNGGEHGTTGMKHTAEARARMSAAAKGKRKGPQSDEHKQRKAEALKKRVTWRHDRYGSEHCSASELMEKYDWLSRAGLSRLKNGACSSYKNWTLA